MTVGKEERFSAYQSRIHESNRAFTDCETFLVDAVEDRSKRRSSGGGTADESRKPFEKYDYIVANLGASVSKRISRALFEGGWCAYSREVWISAPSTIIDTPVDAKTIVVDAIVVWIRWVRGREVIGHRCGLVIWDRINV